MADKTEKSYTLKGVQSEIARLDKSIMNKQAQIKKLTEEIKAEKKNKKALETIHTELYQENLQKQIAAKWFKEKPMTEAQIEKILAVSMQIQDKIDSLDVGDIVTAVNSVYDETAAAETTQTTSETNAAPDKEDSAADTPTNYYGYNRHI